MKEQIKRLIALGVDDELLESSIRSLRGKLPSKDEKNFLPLLLTWLEARVVCIHDVCGQDGDICGGVEAFFETHQRQWAEWSRLRQLDTFLYKRDARRYEDSLVASTGEEMSHLDLQGARRRIVATLTAPRHQTAAQGPKNG